jgi:hypothetical protein
VCCNFLTRELFIRYSSLFSCTPFKHTVSNRQQFTVLRAAFAKKDYRTQFEVRTYFRYLTFHHLTGSTANTFLEYIERNLPESVAMKITKVSNIYHNFFFFPAGALNMISICLSQVSVEKLPEEIINEPQQNISKPSANESE